MYKLLIVDDEGIVVDFLVEIIGKNRPDDLEIYKAFSAYDAIQLLDKKKMDIVITDISMPGMSGIELQHEIRKNWPYCKVIFLTSFNQFEYVQSAIRNDGVDFILKNESEEHIINAVNKAVQSIEQSMKNDELLDKAKQQMRMALPLRRNAFIMEIIQGINYTREEMQYIFSELEIPLAHHMDILLLIGRIDNLNGHTEFNKKSEIVYTLQDMVVQYLRQQDLNIVSVTFEGTKFLWIIQPYKIKGAIIHCSSEALWNNTIAFVHGTLDYIQKAVKESLGVTISFATGNKPDTWEFLSIKFDFLLYSLNKYVGAGKEVLLIDCNQIDDDMNHDRLALSIELKIRSQLKRICILESYLDDGQRKKFAIEYLQIMKGIEESGNISGNIKIEAYYSLAIMFLNYLHKQKLTEKVEININLLSPLEAQLSWKDMSDKFLELANSIFEYKEKENVVNANSIVNKLNEYIENNINKDLSLTMLSEVFHFSPHYISILYKQNSGRNISDYIWEVKLSKAKELLAESNMKINEIAYALGFNTPSYFYYVFKKNTNITPQEYRDLNCK